MYYAAGVPTGKTIGPIRRTYIELATSPSGLVALTYITATSREFIQPKKRMGHARSIGGDLAEQQ